MQQYFNATIFHAMQQKSQQYFMLRNNNSLNATIFQHGTWNYVLLLTTDCTNLT